MNAPEVIVLSTCAIAGLAAAVVTHALVLPAASDARHSIDAELLVPALAASKHPMYSVESELLRAGPMAP
jgi:hypothetical protein